jgi:penicillin-insensitive murein DD-endopeptidase
MSKFFKPLARNASRVRVLLLIALGLGAGSAMAADGVQPAALTSVPVFAKPYPGPAHSIGSPANGCLAGAVALPLSGTGWETLRPGRNRYWGNPALVAFLEDMGGRLASQGRLLVLDMAQPRGGHMTFAHAAHQTGVDVDLMYRLATEPLNDEQRAAPVLDSVVTSDGGLDPARWGDAQTALVKAFATDPRVERIFVNPAIKRALCQSVTGDRNWLRTLRPWWGHDEHFHVRIKCPPGDGACIAGAALPPGDGCGKELAWWFTPEAALPKQPAKPKPLPPIRAECRTILGVE